MNRDTGPKETAMRFVLHWTRFGVRVVVAASMLVFGALFFRHVYVCLCLNQREAAFSSFLLGIILFLVGGGIFYTTVHSIRRVLARDHIEA